MDIVKLEREKRMVKAPDDDVCPFCFSHFVNPCRGPCGHWFCGGCILMYWKYGSVLQPCKCPMCSQIIKKLIPEAPIDSFEDADTLENIKKYNYHFARGRHVVFMRVFLEVLRRGAVELPLIVQRTFAAAMGPNADFTIYDKLRLIMVMIYAFCSPCPYLRGGKQMFGLTFELCTILVFIVLQVVGYIRRWYRRRGQVRQLLE